MTDCPAASRESPHLQGKHLPTQGRTPPTTPLFGQLLAKNHLRASRHLVQRHCSQLSYGQLENEETFLHQPLKKLLVQKQPPPAKLGFFICFFSENFFRDFLKMFSSELIYNVQTCCNKNSAFSSRPGVMTLGWLHVNFLDVCKVKNWFDVIFTNSSLKEKTSPLPKPGAWTELSRIGSVGKFCLGPSDSLAVNWRFLQARRGPELDTGLLCLQSSSLLLFSAPFFLLANQRIIRNPIEAFLGLHCDLYLQSHPTRPLAGNLHDS